MVSFNVTEIILKNLNEKYGFLELLLELLVCLLRSEEFLKTNKSFLEFRRLVGLLREGNEEEVVLMAIECLEILINSSGAFVKSINKIECVNAMNSLIKAFTDSKLLKKVSSLYGLIAENFDDDSA